MCPLNQTAISLNLRHARLLGTGDRHREAMSGMTDDDHTHRHAYHAYEDFRALRKRYATDDKLWHALSHHLRHAVFRTGLRASPRWRRYVRRSSFRRT